MRALCVLGLVSFVLTLPLQAQSSCSPTALQQAARHVVAVRHTLHGMAVTQNDANVPPAVAAQLGELKDALATAAAAAFACAATSDTPDALQAKLAAALHANQANATETVFERGKQDVGAYGSDLAVQVFQLFGTPKFFEVDFRYGIECGDDNLLMVFEAASESSAAWRERLRWGASGYKTVADAIGDFVMLTPVTGSPDHPHWRFVVAHGHPGCEVSPRPSRFDLDLLAPAEDTAHPKVDWHFGQNYTEDHTLPRLATTENTIELRLAQADEQKNSTAKRAAAEVYRFHLSPNGGVEPAASSADTAAAVSTDRSPQ